MPSGIPGGASSLPGKPPLHPAPRSDADEEAASTAKSVSNKEAVAAMSAVNIETATKEAALPRRRPRIISTRRLPTRRMLLTPGKRS